MYGEALPIEDGGKVKPKKTKSKNKGGRPSKPIPKINATAKEIAQRLFSNAKPPDPSIRVRNRPD